jgi:hydroxylamine reductase
VKGILLDPTLPGFLSTNVGKILIGKSDINAITTPEEDLAAMMAGH